MTVSEKRTKIGANHKKVVAQKNIYDQHAVRRECVLKKHTDGKNYSDCSSAVRKVTEDVDPSVKPMGGNTVAQYQNKKAVVVNCKIVKGVPTDIEALRVGDCLYFAGTDSSRAYADYVGHVEQIHSIVNGKVMLFGHGSGNPKIRDMAEYCKSRQAAATKTKKGNKGLLKVLRFVRDEQPTGGNEDTSPTDVLGSRILKFGMSGNDVKELQRALKALGFFGGSIGGNYLEITKEAVEAFQKKHGLSVDGEFGPKSLAALLVVQGEDEKPTTGKAKTIVTTGNAYLRVGPGTEYEDKGIAKLGSKLVALIDTDGKPVIALGCYAIIYDNEVLWISAKYSKVTEV